VQTGQFYGIEGERLTVGEIVADLFRRRANVEIRGGKSLKLDEGRWKKNLSPAFEKMKTRTVNRETLSRYSEKRREAGADNASINRELAVLSRAFRLCS